MLHLGPKGLEEAYQSDPEKFKSDFIVQGLTASKEPLALAWTYRLGLQPHDGGGTNWGNTAQWFTLGMTFAAFFFFRLPDWIGTPRGDWFLPYIGPVFIVPFMAFHTTIHKAWGRMRIFWIGLLGLLVLNVLVDQYWGRWDYELFEWGNNSATELQESSSVSDPFALVRQTQVLFQFHLPLLLWGLLGYLYTKLYASEARVDFVRHSVQVALFAFIVALAGGALIGLTGGLLDLLDFPQFFVENLAIWGLCGLPFFGHYLWYTNKQVMEKILPTLARIFIPLFLLVVTVFLLTYTIQGIDQLRSSREELFIFNLLLILVIGLVMMHYAFDEDKHPIITLGVGALVALTLVADGIGLWAIGSRMFEFGLTPNRITVLFGNLIFAVALSGVLLAILRSKNGAAAPVRGVLNTMLAVFVGWTLIVVLVFPVFYGRYDQAEKKAFTKDHPRIDMYTPGSVEE